MATKGLLSKKIGMTQVFTEKGELLPVTVLEAGPCVVIALRAIQKDGYGAVQLGFGAAKEKQLNKPAAGHFKKAGVAAHRHVREIRLKADASYEIGQALKADLFSAGELVDVTGTTKGKGFSGQHKRHHFGRGPVTHGSHNIKQPGSIGSSTATCRATRTASSSSAIRRASPKGRRRSGDRETVGDGLRQGRQGERPPGSPSKHLQRPAQHRRA